MRLESFWNDAAARPVRGRASRFAAAGAADLDRQRIADTLLDTARAGAL
jgi:hypothetical protein